MYFRHLGDKEARWLGHTVMPGDLLSTEHVLKENN